MTDGRHEVKLCAGSLELLAKSYEIESDLMSPADAFSISVSNLTGIAKELNEEDPVRVTVDGELVLVGNIDELDCQGGELAITGRDRGRFLVDCSAAVVSLRGKTLLSLAERLTGAFDGHQAWIPLWEQSPPGGVLPRIKKMKIDPGESIFDALTRFAKPARRLVWVTEDGKGVIGRPNYHQKPAYSLYRYGPESEYRCKNNIIQGGVRRSSRDRFASTTVLSSVSNSGSIFGGGASKLRGTATDDGIRTGKPKVMPGQAVDTAQAAILAQEEVEKAKYEGWVATYTVRGHGQGDELWKANRLCTLVDEPCGVEGGTYFVSRRRFRGGGAAGATTEVELHPAGVYLA
jgi:prophage tail gpP-like protein